MHPVYKAETGGKALIGSDGSSANVPTAILDCAQHRIMDANQWLIDLLGNPRTGREHDAPLMDTCKARPLLCSSGLVELKHVAWTCEGISKTCDEALRRVQLHLLQLRICSLQVLASSQGARTGLTGGPSSAQGFATNSLRSM